MVWKGKQASKEERREALNRAVVSAQNDDSPSFFIYTITLQLVLQKVIL